MITSNQETHLLASFNRRKGNKTMCIAIYKPMGVKTPSNDIFQRCFEKNSDGAGYMYSHNGKVHIEKGLMTFDDFKKSVENTFKKLGGKKACKKIPMVFHFRITTQGGVQKELTHPFAFSNNYEDMRKTSLDVDCGVAHNGIISATSSNANDHNDTMEFIKDIAYPLMNSHDKTLDVHNLIEKFLHGNRVIFLHGNGSVEMFGDWTEDKGVFYSNDGYKESSFKLFSSYGGYYSHLYGVNANKVDRKKIITKKEDLRVFSPWQKEDMLQWGESWCEECGGDLDINYDDVLDCWVATCRYCGERYYVDDETFEEIFGYADDEDYYYAH